MSVYKGATWKRYPHIRRLLLERYYFELPHEILSDLPDEFYQKVKRKVEWRKDTVSTAPVYIYDHPDGEEIFMEDFPALARRVANRIAAGYFVLVERWHGYEPDRQEVIKHFSDPETARQRAVVLAKRAEKLMLELKFLPSSPFLFNAGRGAIDNPELLKLLYKPADKLTIDEWNKIAHLKDPAYGSCYAMGEVGDSIDDIFAMLHTQAEVFRHAGGFGANFSKLRSKYAWVSTIKGHSSGPLMFMRLFNENTYIIALHANTKRGANMFHLDITHPEIEEFIDLKTDFDKGYENIKYANISVGFFDKFFEALKENKPWTLIDPHDPSIKLEKDPKHLWAKFATNATIHAEPGFTNWDIINANNPFRYSNIEEYRFIHSTNPCSEHISVNQSVCVLGSVNVFAFVDNDGFDLRGFKDAIITGHEFLTIANFANDYPFETLNINTRRLRNTGIGVMGIASTLAYFGLRYGAKDAFEWTWQLMNTFAKTVAQSSDRLAAVIGRHYGFDQNANVELQDDGTYLYTWNVHNPDPNGTVRLDNGLANAFMMAVAPTGSISYIANVSSGVEPIFSLKYKRRINPDMPNEYETTVVDEAVAVWCEQNNKSIDKITKADLPDSYIEASDVGILEKIAMLYAFDMNIDMNASTTFNIPRTIKPITPKDAEQLLEYSDYFEPVVHEFSAMRVDIQPELKELIKTNEHYKRAFEHFIETNPGTTKDEKIQRGCDIIQAVSDFYLLANAAKIKGTTVYVENTRRPILKKESKQSAAKFSIGNLDLKISPKTGHILPQERPAFITSIKKEIRFQFNGDVKKFYVEVGFNDQNNEPFEVFFRATESSKDLAEFFNLAGRMASLCLRSGVDFHEIIKQIKKVKNWRNDYSPIAKLMAETVVDIVEFYKARGKKKQQLKAFEEERKHWIYTAKGYYIDQDGKPRCPVCGNILKLESGCAQCSECGFTACVDA